MPILQRIAVWVILLSLWLFMPGYSQSHVAWYFASIRWKNTEKWNSQLEFHERHFLDNGYQQLFMSRYTLTRQVSGYWSAGAGASCFMQSMDDSGFDLGGIQPEFRPHADVTFTDSIGRLVLRIRNRNELRLMQDRTPGWVAFWRFRARLSLEIPVCSLGNGMVLFRAGDEILIQAGRPRLPGFRIDQNRIFSAISAPVIPGLQFEVAWMPSFHPGGLVKQNWLLTGTATIGRQKKTVQPPSDPVD